MRGCFPDSVAGNEAVTGRVYSVEDMKNSSDLYRCGYCGADLPYETRETLRHVVRHLGEAHYLPAYHQHLERRGHDELSAHLLTIRVASALTRLSA